MKARLAVPVAALLAAALCAVFLPFMKAAVDGGLKARAQAALAARGLGSVRVGSNWATLTLSGPASARAAAVAAVSRMPDAGAARTIRYDAAGQPGGGAAAGAGRAAGGSGSAAGSGQASGGSAAAPSARRGRNGAAQAGLAAAALAARIRGALGRRGVEFASDSAVLTPRSDRALRRVAALMKRDPAARLRIDGFTDSQGSAAVNAVLSRARARSALAYLTARGIAAARLTAEGFGASRPVASNGTAAGRQANRRIEFSVRGG